MIETWASYSHSDLKQRTHAEKKKDFYEEQPLAYFPNEALYLKEDKPNWLNLYAKTDFRHGETIDILSGISKFSTKIETKHFKMVSKLGLEYSSAVGYGYYTQWGFPNAKKVTAHQSNGVPVHKKLVAMGPIEANTPITIFESDKYVSNNKYYLESNLKGLYKYIDSLTEVEIKKYANWKPESESEFIDARREQFAYLTSTPSAMVELILKNEVSYEKAGLIFRHVKCHSDNCKTALKMTKPFYDNLVDKGPEFRKTVKEFFMPKMKTGYIANVLTAGELLHTIHDLSFLVLEEDTELQTEFYEAVFKVKLDLLWESVELVVCNVLGKSDADYPICKALIENAEADAEAVWNRRFWEKLPGAVLAASITSLLLTKLLVR